MPHGTPPIKPPLVYLSGPMTGLPDLNFPAFHAAADKLRSQGVQVVNPAELDHPSDATWPDYMRRDIAELVRCDWIALLPGWENSKGAHLEYTIATKLGMPALRLPENF